MKARGLWQRFRHDTNGGTAVEFGLAFPMVLFTSLAVLELSLFYFGNQTITNTMNQAIRKGMIGCERSEFDIDGRCRNVDNVIRIVDIMSIRRHIARKTNGLVDACDTEKFTITIYPIDKPGAANTVDMGLGGDVVVYKASYKWPVFTPVMWTLGKFFDSSFNTFNYATYVRNEKFFRSKAMGDARSQAGGAGNDCEWKGTGS